MRARTSELATANTALRAEIIERVRIERERLALFEREQTARAHAESVNRMKDEFLATLSHELRTPLNAILGWAHLLTSGKADEATTQRALGVIRNNAMAQSQLIEDILDVSRIISGKLRLNLAAVSLRAVIEEALDSVAPAAEAKCITIARHLDDVEAITGDKDRLQQVFWNLLSNAVKFTPRDGRVAVRLERGRRRCGHCRRGQRHRHQPGFPALRVRSVHAGRRVRHAPPRRPRARDGDRAPPRRAARRHRARATAKGRTGARRSRRRCRCA